ncbi:2-oxo-4-hydroxy-4-carboxy-5-ureidoimidazoline decarboxylase [Kyrpidia sp.]|uniref:2-oxo-4-hydroxy-4-carboxy-5-ureidoimidazoline decarboxylase n=1 Tax=Kyrpidia sp. TaxID=2073077 RepID=UPI0025896B6D|nr:2-oxo-4-hydroxy-4-carboxy-5-ureidoimidazoline decarboxylase [Kyrpidia sp.]
MRWWAKMVTLTQLNGATKQEFTEMVGWVFEHSPWVAERAWARRPFRSVDHLFAVMADVVKGSTRDDKLALFRAHPDLGARARMSSASLSEQHRAGLQQLSFAEYHLLTRLNRAYRDKFGFPFILAVRDRTPREIQKALEQRLAATQEEEEQRALSEVLLIAWFRLRDMGIEER